VTDRAALHVQKPAPSAVQTGGRAMTPPPVQQCKPVAGAQTCALTPRWWAQVACWPAWTAVRCHG